uniref:GUN4-like domain-containing protein n=1 Tax=Helminthora furcellata TaxID=1884666 RepID=A0A1G4NQW2_9FLOR|nr:Hypothetical protein ycf53 [Helminthora furcellata]SCW21060.1 Hypothetical protein ycf53 [Helminthora furcellata]SCW23920.1 Hypothetical protein ycf53 [Helminthora furcellata]
MLRNIEDLDCNCKELLNLLSSYDVSMRYEAIDLVNKIYHSNHELHLQLLVILLDRYDNHQIAMNIVDGIMFELLLKSENSNIYPEIVKYLPTGIIKLKSDCGIDYLPLQKLLLAKKFQDADALTHVLLCKLSQKLGNHSRQWLYFTDVVRLPCIDLHTIDQLWQVHSEGLFGLSAQKRIWLSTNSDWEKFWAKIGWKVNNVSCRYPQEFTWDTNAPAGHLPLFNQLRGVQVLAALFDHPAF